MAAYLFWWFLKFEFFFYFWFLYSSALCLAIILLFSLHRMIQCVLRDGRCIDNWSVFLGGWLFRSTVSKAGTGGKTVSLPVASILAIVTATLGAGVDPDGLSCRNHLAA